MRNLFLKEILSYGKIYSCTDYLLFAIIPFHLSSQMFSGMFFAWMRFNLYVENNIFTKFSG